MQYSNHNVSHFKLFKQCAVRNIRQILQRTMNLKALFLAATIFVSTAAMAQSTSAAGNGLQRNRIYTAVLSNVKYDKEEKKLDVGNTLGQIASAVINRSAVNISTETPESNANGVVAAILRGMTNTHRIRVTDGTGALDSGESQYDFVIDVMVTKAATTYTTNTVEKTFKDKDGKEYRKKVNVDNYKAHIDVTLCQKDTRTKEIVVSPKFVVNDYNGTGSKSQTMTNALTALSNKVSNYYRRIYPLYANIIEGAKAKKDKQKELYIDLGQAEGAYSGLHMTVYETKQVAGKEARQQLGVIKITEVQGDDISLCKVQKGGKDIKSAIDEGKTLLVVTTD